MLSVFLLLPLFDTLVFLICIVSMTGIACRVGIVDVLALSSLCVLVSQEIFHRFVGLLY
jgi:hypothetical protein